MCVKNLIFWKLTLKFLIIDFFPMVYCGKQPELLITVGPRAKHTNFVSPTWLSIRFLTRQSNCQTVAWRWSVCLDMSWPVQMIWLWRAFCLVGCPNRWPSRTSSWCEAGWLTILSETNFNLVPYFWQWPKVNA